MKTATPSKTRSQSSSQRRPAKSKTSSRRGPSSAARKAAAPRGRSRHTSQSTTDHDEIRRWAEARGGHPAAVKRTGGKKDVGIIRLDFPGFSGSRSLEEITWDEFFEKFEDSKLALVYQKETAGGERSNFNKLVKR